MNEALKRALEALDALCLNDYSGYEMGKRDTHLVDSAIDAIKAALEQPVQEPDHGDELTIAYMSGVHRGKELAAQPAQQEHDVDATIIQYHEATIKRLEKRIEELAQPAQEPDYWLGYGLQAHTEKPFEGATTLYTTPQQRLWIGLTFAEICDAEVVATDGFNNFSELKFARAIEAKLKELNT